MSAPIKGRQLAALRISTRETWRQIVVHALCGCKGEVRAAAKELDVVERTVHRWIRETDVKEALQAKALEENVVLPNFLQKPTEPTDTS